MPTRYDSKISGTERVTGTREVMRGVMAERGVEEEREETGARERPFLALFGSAFFSLDSISSSLFPSPLVSFVFLSFFSPFLSFSLLFLSLTETVLCSGRRYEKRWVTSANVRGYLLWIVRYPIAGWDVRFLCMATLPHGKLNNKMVSQCRKSPFLLILLGDQLSLFSGSPDTQSQNKPGNRKSFDKLQSYLQI